VIKEGIEKFQAAMRKEMTFWLVLSLVIHVATMTSIELFNRRNFIKISSPGPIRVTLIEPHPRKTIARKKRPKSQIKIYKHRIVKSVPRSKVVVRKQRIVRRIKKGAIPTKNPREEQLKKAIKRIQKKVEQREAPADRTIPATGGGAQGEKNLYFSVIRNKVMQGWVIPENLIEDVYSLEAIVNFTIYSDGHISDVYLEESSGNKYFDESVLRAIKKAVPFPPLPPSISKKSIEIGIRFRPGEKEDG